MSTSIIGLSVASLFLSAFRDWAAAVRARESSKRLAALAIGATDELRRIAAATAAASKDAAGQMLDGGTRAAGQVIEGGSRLRDFIVQNRMVVSTRRLEGLGGSDTGNGGVDGNGTGTGSTSATVHPTCYEADDGGQQPNLASQLSKSAYENAPLMTRTPASCDGAGDTERPADAPLIRTTSATPPAHHDDTASAATTNVMDDPGNGDDGTATAQHEPPGSPGVAALPQNEA